jgi:preprotein translocase subunit SecA
MASIKNEVLSNLFRSTTNLMAFEQFLSSLPFNVGQRLEGRDQHSAGGPLPGRGDLAFSQQDQSQTDGEELELVIPSARRESPKVGRNDPCPCGSGKKYKNCCGRTA